MREAHRTPSPRTIAGVDGNIRAGHSQMEGDVPIAPRVGVGRAHSEDDTASRCVLWKQHLEKEETPVRIRFPPAQSPQHRWEGGLGLARQPKPRSSSLSLARETTGKGSVLLDPSRAPQPLAWASALQHTLPKAAFNRDLPRSHHKHLSGPWLISHLHWPPHCTHPFLLDPLHPAVPLAGAGPRVTCLVSTPSLPQ